MCEYDAVADVGHAAGHNLKTEASVAAALALKQALKDGSLKTGTVSKECRLQHYIKVYYLVLNCFRHKLLKCATMFSHLVII